jgi:hypothetical protein
MPQILSDAIPASATLANSVAQFRGVVPLRIVPGSAALQSTIDTSEQRVACFRDQATLAASTDSPAGNNQIPRRAGSPELAITST